MNKIVNQFVGEGLLMKLVGLENILGVKLNADIAGITIWTQNSVKILLMLRKIYDC